MLFYSSQTKESPFTSSLFPPINYRNIQYYFSAFASITVFPENRKKSIQENSKKCKEMFKRLSHNQGKIPKT